MFATITTPPQVGLDLLALSGFLSAVAWMFCWFHRHANATFQFGLIVFSVSLTGFAFCQTGAWPLGMVLAIFTGSLATRWVANSRAARSQQPMAQSQRRSTLIANEPSRLERLFGSAR